MEDLKKQFRAIKWNASAGLLTKEQAAAAGLTTDHFYNIGEIMQGEQNSFSVDIMFAASEPGFVVQYITRNIVNKDTDELIHNDAYWEIFYIGKDQIQIDGTTYFLAYNPDAFKLGGIEGKKLENVLYTQTGVATFYPYAGNIVEYTQRNTMKYNKSLGELTGWTQANFGKDKELAGGLPYSKDKEPTMVGLSPLPFHLHHIVRSSWDNTMDGSDVKHEQKLEELFMYTNTKGHIIGDLFELDRANVDGLSSNQLLELGKKLETYAVDNKLMTPGQPLTPDLAKNIIIHISERHFAEGGSKKRTIKKIKEFKEKNKKTKSKKLKIKKKKI